MKALITIEMLNAAVPNDRGWLAKLIINDQEVSLDFGKTACEAFAGLTSRFIEKAIEDRMEGRVLVKI
jgi:hypothetical protein